MKAKHRIWIEFEEPSKFPDEYNQEQVELANNMLRRIQGSPVLLHYFTYEPSQRKFFYGNDGGDLLLNDNGHWFNLDFFGRTEDGPN